MKKKIIGTYERKITYPHRRAEGIWKKFFQRNPSGKLVELKGDLKEMSNRINVVVVGSPVTIEELEFALSLLR